MHDTDAHTREGFHQTAGGDVRDPWTPLAELRRTVGVLTGDVMPSTGDRPFGARENFAVLRYDDCARVLRDDVTFSSRVYEDVMGPVMGRTILQMEEPEHRRTRNLAGNAFRQKALQHWEDELVRPLAHEMIDGFAPRGHAELAEELTYPFPVQVIARILDLPRADVPYFQTLAFRITSVGAGYDDGKKASAEMAEYLLPFIPRLVMSDVEIAGVTIPAGSTVTVCLGSANRDETRFADPDRFDIHRPEGQHLAFSSGPHMCLGMHLARMEMRVVLNALLDRLADLELDPGDRDPHMHGIGFRSPTCLPVRFTPVAA